MTKPATPKRVPDTVLTTINRTLDDDDCNRRAIALIEAVLWPIVLLIAIVVVAIAGMSPLAGVAGLGAVAVSVWRLLRRTRVRRNTRPNRR